MTVREGRRERRRKKAVKKPSLPSLTCSLQSQQRSWHRQPPPSPESDNLWIRGERGGEIGGERGEGGSREWRRGEGMDVQSIAYPPPLMQLRSLSTSSAPSIATSS